MRHFTYPGKQKNAGRFCNLIIILILVCFCSLTAIGQNNSSLFDNLPSAEKVKQTIRANTAYKTAARQYSAFYQLNQIANDIAAMEQISYDDPRFVTLKNSYVAAMNKLDVDSKILQGSNNDRTDWYRDRSALDYDKRLANELYSKFFPAGTQRLIERNKAAIRQQQSMAEQKKQNEVNAEFISGRMKAQATKWKIIYGVIYALCILLFIAALRSYKRHMATQEFDSQDVLIYRNGNKIYPVSLYTGRVFENKNVVYTNINQTTYINNNNQRSVSVSSSTDDVEKIHVICSDGKERYIQLTNTGFSISLGSQISGAYIEGIASDWDGGFAFHIHNLNRWICRYTSSFFYGSSFGIFSRFLLLAILCFVKVYLVSKGNELSYFRENFLLIEQLEILVAVICMIILPVMVKQRVSSATKKFVQKDRVRLIEAIRKFGEKHADKVPAVIG